MWKLTIEDDDGQRTSLELGQEEYTIGRSEESIIRLTERNVSRDHAVLRLVGETWQLDDVGSYNGTFINGERVTQPTDLASDDVINLGDYRIELLDATALAVQEMEETRLRRPDRLVMVIGPAPGSEFALVGEMLTIGRAEEAQISINHASVSRLHADVVRVGDSRWEVVDRGSSNGIRINGMDLRRGMIEAGDALELGDVRLRFVGAGKYFRPSTSVQMAAIPFNGSAPGVVASGPVSGRGLGTMLAVGAVVVAVIVGLVVVLFAGSGDGGPEGAATAAPMATSEAEAQQLLKDAIDSDDPREAHEILMRIPDGSPVRDSKAFRELEDDWADAIFDEVEETDDVKEKLELLYQISDATTVSTDKRRRALEMADEIDPNPTRPRPKIAPTPRTPTPTGGGVVAPSPPSGLRPPSPTPAPAPTTKATVDPKFDMSAQKQPLLNKAQRGTASMNELRMLKAICMQDGDRQCRQVAVQGIKALKNKNP